MSSNILSYLSKIPDSRRKQGLRYPQDKMLALVLIGTLAGRVGFRSITRFCKAHEKHLSKVLDLKHGVPSHVSLTSIIDKVSYKDFERAVNNWSKSKKKISKKNYAQKNLISIDGKAIRSSVRNGISKSQNFVAFVNAFCLDKEIVLTSIAYENGNGNEREILRDLINELGIKNAVITADAAHPSKKLLK